MKLMIEVPDSFYSDLKENRIDLGAIGCQLLLDKVKNGTPLEECNDAISRQAAIEVIKSMSNANPSHWNNCDVIDRENTLDEIEELPPVTPQYTDAEIQKMQDLESAEIQKAYEIGKAENPNRWVSVIEDIKSEINELSELDHIEPTYEDCKRDVLEIINKRISGAKMQEGGQN